MTAKQQAVKDIKRSLKEQRVSFLAFHRELDPVMEEIVNDYLEEQKKIS